MKKLRFPILLIVLGFVGLLAASILQGGIPEIQAREVRDASYVGRRVKVHGILHEIESIQRPLRFTIRDKTQPEILVPVVADKTKPDTFQAGYDISVEGQWDAAGHFAADKIMTKCPSKYEAEAKDGRGAPTPEEAKRAEAAKGQGQ